MPHIWHPGRGSHWVSCCHSLSGASVVSTIPMLPVLLTVVLKSHDLGKIKGSCITISDWVIFFPNKIWNSIEKNLHRSIKGRDIKKRKKVALRHLISQLGGLIPARGNCTWAAELVFEGIAMPTAAWHFISCGHACICPRRPSPGWPPCWSSPHHSCCDTPGGGGGENTHNFKWLAPDGIPSCVHRLSELLWKLKQAISAL